MPLHESDGDRLRAGERATRSGIYRVFHHAHRGPHEVMISAGTVLPSCRFCGPRVQYALLNTAGVLEEEPDFSSADEIA